MKKRPRISFGITTCNEGESLQTLLNQLIPHCNATGDEVVILADYSMDELTGKILADAVRNDITVRYRALENNFAKQKNHLTNLCHGDYTCQVDADETLHPVLLDNLHSLIDANSDVDLYYIPRVNVVNGLTQEDISKWNWTVNEKGWVMFPDYQGRLYRRAPGIEWTGKVHERITGHKKFTHLPPEEEWAFYHTKEIERQRRQNEFYSSI